MSTLSLTYLVRQKADSETNWSFSRPTYPVCLLKNNIWMDLKSLRLIHHKIMRWTFWVLVQIFWTKLCKILICFRICLLPDERSERKCTQHADTFAELNPSFSENIVFQVRQNLFLSVIPCFITFTQGPTLCSLLLVLCRIWQYGFWSFQTGCTKLERFLHKNQHTQRNLLNFENWTNGEPQ